MMHNILWLTFPVFLTLEWRFLVSLSREKKEWRRFLWKSLTWNSREYICGMPVAYFISRSVGIISERVGQKLCQSYCHRKSEKEKSNGVGTFLVVGSVNFGSIRYEWVLWLLGAWESSSLATQSLHKLYSW